MPYNIKKIGKGYKVFKKGTSKSFSKKPLTKKKAEDQMKALYANESLVTETETQHDTLEYFKLWKYPKLNQYHLWFKLGSGKDILFTLVYSAGETMDDIDYIETQVTDPGIPNIEIFEDPHSEEAKEILDRHGLTGDDIENAGQEGYEKINRYVPKKEVNESSEFQNYFDSLFE